MQSINRAADQIQKLCVPAERLKAEGFAFQRRVISNSNEEGRK